MNEAGVARVLTIAGSDSGGGAGIQADLKTFTALGVYGMSVITAVTAQNTTAVTGVHEIPPAFVAEQLDAVASDIGVDAVKIGMLSNAPIIEAVADGLLRHRLGRVVLDPVMVAKSGDALLAAAARETLVDRLLPHALVVTPNAHEAEAMTGRPVNSLEDMRNAARALFAMGPKHVLVKGGHVPLPDALDLLYDGETFREFASKRVETPNTHGTGCTYSSAIAAYLALGHGVADAVQQAKRYLDRAIAESLSLGRGHGPLKHYWPLDSASGR